MGFRAETLVEILVGTARGPTQRCRRRRAVRCRGRRIILLSRSCRVKHGAPERYDVSRRSEMEDTLHIAEIPYETGEVRFRYVRRLSPDGTKWIRDGRFVEYSRAGQILAEGEYVCGAEVGTWRDYFENGQIAAEGAYQDGKEDGIWHFWHEDGTPEEPVVFRNGVRISQHGG